MLKEKRVNCKIGDQRMSLICRVNIQTERLRKVVGLQGQCSQREGGGGGGG